MCQPSNTATQSLFDLVYMIGLGFKALPLWLAGFDGLFDSSDTLQLMLMLASWINLLTFLVTQRFYNVLLLTNTVLHIYTKSWLFFWKA